MASLSLPGSLVKPHCIKRRPPNSLIRCNVAEPLKFKDNGRPCAPAQISSDATFPSFLTSNQFRKLSVPQNQNDTRLRIFSGTANPALSQEIACYMGLELGKIKIKRFADGEIYVQLQESVRGCDVYLVQPTCPPANENLMELLIMIDACRRASAKNITAVIPYFGYARADRKTQGRESIAAKLVANLITEAGADRVLACDLHSGQSMGYFDIPVDHVHGQPVILDYLASKTICSDDLVVVSPDVGGVARARAFAKKLSDAPLAIVDKRRHAHNVAEVMNLIGSCVQMHNISYVNQCLDLMEHQMVGKNEITYYQLLKLAVFQQNLPAVHEIWKECTKHYKPSIIFLRKFIWSFSKLRDMESAYLTLQQMVDMVFQGGFLISKTAEGKMRNLRLDIPAPCKGDSSLLRSAKENEGFMHSADRYYNDMSMHASTSEHCFNIGNIKKSAFDISKSTVGKQKSIAAMKLLKWSFSDVMHACAVTQNDVLAEQLLYQMRSLGLQPSRQTYNAFTMAVLNSRGFHDAIEVVKIMEKKNIKPYDSTLVCLSVSCSRNLELDLAESFLDQISAFEGPYPFNAFLEACDALDLPERAVQSLTKMKKLNIQPDIRTYELLFSLFGSVNAPFMEENLMFQNDAAKQIRAIDMDMMKNGIQHSQLSMMNLLKALGTRGLVKEMIQYLQAAENPIPHYRSSLGTTLYNTVLHMLVRAKETNAAISIFKGMISCGVSPDAATYTIMIDCCTIIDNFKSACILVSRMIRDGFFPQIFTYTSLIKILMESEDFGEAFRLLNQGILDGIQPDVLLYNRIVQKASEKGRIDVIELFVEQMHRDRIQPNSSICRNVFLAYADRRFYKTAIEALQVLSMRMISLDDNVLDERQAEYEHLILNEETEDETKITNLFFEDGKEDHSIALLILRWCAILGFPISWTSNKSQWAKRLSMNYDRSIQVADDNSGV